MRETPEDLARLQELLDRSYATAGRHLREVITAERRLDAFQLATRLSGMCLLTLATVTADGRPITGAVDGFFYRGEWYFGSSDDSVRFRHLRSRPNVSATHLPGEALSVAVHGRAHEIDVVAHDAGRFRDVLLEYYGIRFGAAATDVFDGPGVAYARIEAERMFTFWMNPAESGA